jgi:bifunctional enzyme CysN/CysC
MEQSSQIIYSAMDLLRFTTAGSVDDGKSTLIGRLLYDSKSIFEDQLEAIESTSRKSGEEQVNLALLTDGLRAEREQKITIDVAYRYFATPRRKFIIADTPGHVQYTRNMVTGASTADLAIILVDARKGLQTQSRRHAFIASLLQIPHVILAVNKMDLVDYNEDQFNGIVDDFRDFSQRMELPNVTYIPISALRGDNIVHKSLNMDWYNGSTLLHTLETVHVGTRRNMVDFRFPVQYILRPNQNFRGFAGMIVSGSVRTGDDVLVLPSKQRSSIKRISKYNSIAESASAGDSVTIELHDEMDVSRGDMIVRTANIPRMATEFEAQVCWMDAEPMLLHRTYKMMHTTRVVSAIPVGIRYRTNPDTLHRETAESLLMNEIGRIRLRTTQPVFADPYTLNNATGSFVLIDPATNVTVAAGMIRGVETEDDLSATNFGASKDIIQGAVLKSPNVVWESWNISRDERERKNYHKAIVLWFTGVSGAGKSTIARLLERRLWSNGCQTVMLDGDQLRHGLNGNLGFSSADRTENIRRAGEVAKLLYEHGLIVICSFVSPIAADRNKVRSLLPDKSFFEILVTCSQNTAMNRDPKGLYKKAQEGRITGLTGYDDVYEEGISPELILDTDSVNPEEAVQTIIMQLKSEGYSFEIL